MSLRGSAYGSMSDDELAGTFKKEGDIGAFEELWLRHKKEVYLHCYSFFRREPGEAEDVTQKTFIKAFEKRDQFDTGSYIGWLKRIARNMCLDRIRERRPVISFDTANEVPAPQSDVDRQIEVERLYKEIAKLPVDQRQCLDLQMRGYSYDEVATRLNVTVEAVRSHIQNGKRTLKLRMLGAQTR